MDAMSSGCRPLVYVYDLPTGYQQDGKLQHAESPLGLAVTPPAMLDPTTRLYSAVVYGTGAALFGRVRQYHCTTRDPSAADLFFVPAFTARLPSSHAFCAEAPRHQPHNCSRRRLFNRINALRNDLGTSYLRRRNGRDHILPTGHQGVQLSGSWPYYELHITDPRLGEASILGTEENVPSIPHWPAKARPSPRFISVPWSSSVHVAADAKWHQAPWRQKLKRMVLIGAAFGFRGHSKALTFPLRAGLYYSCVNHPRSVCTYLKLAPRLTQTQADRSVHKEVTAIAALYYNSTFCLQPLGDGPTRAGIIDALLLGCIPVLFHPAQLKQWPRHWGSWGRNATVLLDVERYKYTRPPKPRNGSATAKHISTPQVHGGRQDIVATLLAIPPERVAHMQHTIRSHAHCVHYFDTHASARDDGTEEIAASRVQLEGSIAGAKSRIGSEYDAFDIAIRAAWRRARRLPEPPPEMGDCRPIIS